MLIQTSFFVFVSFTKHCRARLSSIQANWPSQIQNLSFFFSKKTQSVCSWFLLLVFLSLSPDDNNKLNFFLDFEEFSLSQPDENGFCTTDSFMVRTTVGERLPIICGENAGQHSMLNLFEFPF